MIKHLTSKIALLIYLLIFAILIFWAFNVYKARNENSSNTPQQTFSNDPFSSTTDPDNFTSEINVDNDEQAPSTVDNPSIDINNLDAPININQDILGPKLANITAEHCNTNCQAFAIDLQLFEYCEQSCGISPIKNVADCNDKKDLSKDYCTKDLAIIRKDDSICDKINDANIKQSCKNRIEQDALEDLQRSNPRSEPEF